MMDTPLHILYAEDDEEDRFFFREGVAESGEPVVMTEFPDGSFLIRFLMALDDPGARPYAIVSDMNMPAMGGKDVLKMLQVNSRLQHIPAIILTTSSSPEDKAACRALGAKGFFSKPDSVEKVKSTVSDIILLCKSVYVAKQS